MKSAVAPSQHRGILTEMWDLSAQDLMAIKLSLKVATVAMIATMPLAIAVGYILARWQFRGKILVDGLVQLPLVVPPVVTGYVLLLAFGRQGPIGAFLAQTFGIVFSFRWTGAALAAAVMGFPLFVRATRLAIEAVDRRTEEAAATLGASPLWVFFTVTAPLSMQGIIAGALLCFAKALGEFGATITFVSNIPGETQTIPSAIFSYTQTPGGDASAITLSCVAIAVSLLALIVSEILARRAWGRGAQLA